MPSVNEARFWQSTDQLFEEVSGGSKQVQRSAESAREITREFHGPHWEGRSTASAGETVNGGPENHTWAYITAKLPELVYNNPRVVVRTRRADLRDVAAEPLRHALNRWSIDHQTSKLLERLAQDMLISFGVAMVTLEENPGVELPADGIPDAPDVPMWPVPKRVPPTDYTVDAKARTIDEARFQGHRFIRSKLSILNEAAEDPESGWDREAVKNLKVQPDYDRRRPAAQSGYEAPHREDVILWEVWIPEAQMRDFGLEEPEEGEGDDYNGVICTLADHQDQSGWPREPRPYYGPPTGPYVVFGAYNVPDSVLPVSPLLAHREQAIALNRLAAANMRSAMRYKRLIVANDTDPDITEKVQDSEHDGVMVMQGVDRAGIIPVELGGITAQMVAHQQQARDYLDRVSGMSDPQRGNTQTGETATAVAVAENASDARDDFVKHKFHQGASELFRLAAFLMWDNETVIFPLGPEADEAILSDEDREAGSIAWFQGSSMGGSFQDNQFEIEPFSMERSSGGVQMRRQMESDQMLINTLPVMIQNPQVNWKDWWARRSDLMNVPGGGELIDWDVLAQLQEVFLQGQVQAMQQAQPQGRMAGEMGVQPPQGGGRPAGQRGSAQGALAGRETGALAGAGSQA